jgi:hypothetical protein
MGQASKLIIPGIVGNADGAKYNRHRKFISDYLQQQDDLDAGERLGIMMVCTVLAVHDHSQDALHNGRGEVIESAVALFRRKLRGLLP